MKLCMAECDPTAAVFYGLAYMLLMRVASELIPLETNGIVLSSRENSFGGKSKMQCGPDEIRLHLRARKNEQLGATIVRFCSCKVCRQLCPVHASGAWLASLKFGARPFNGYTSSFATRELRRRLRVLQIESADCYTLHSFRRGRAQDLAASGHTVAQIMAEGGWKSGSWAQYLDPGHNVAVSPYALICNLTTLPLTRVKRQRWVFWRFAK